MKSSVHFAPNRYLENIGKMFKKLYNDEQLADVTLCCKDGTIKAHKIILATCSPYFHRIFTENRRDHPILIMHGVPYHLLHDLIELIYKGNVDVHPETLNPLYELAGEFQLSGISGVLREEVDRYTNLDNGNSYGRDTRYRGQKRVAVDYKDMDPNIETVTVVPPKKLHENPKDSIEQPKKNPLELPHEDTRVKLEVITDFALDTSNPDEDVIPINNFDAMKEPPKLSAWAKKQRKFKCELCPSSFKRSSHLTRHQLVHTGERPYACHQCDKAFSRHDKLKHHIKKAHEQDFESDYGLELMGHPMVETPEPPPSPVRQSPSPPPFVIAHVRSEAVIEEETPNPPKRPRGRPRKYPPVEKPLIKRGRGRPRLNPIKPENENYDITNLPYGDLDVLTMPLQETGMIEPLVEIQTEKEESPEKNNTEEKTSEEPVVVETDCETRPEDEIDASAVNLKDIENRIAKIGECTISVANH